MLRAHAWLAGSVLSAAGVLCLCGLSNLNRPGGDIAASIDRGPSTDKTPREGDAGVGRARSEPRPRGVNAIVAENALPGNPASEWDISGPGDASIQGFATDISVNRGETDRLQDQDRRDRLPHRHLSPRLLRRHRRAPGRDRSTVGTLPQAQPACFFDAETGLVDCGNWGVSASWDVPADAVSGIYIAKLVREDPTTAARATSCSSCATTTARSRPALPDLGHDLAGVQPVRRQQPLRRRNVSYTGPAHGAKVSYNRPFTTRAERDARGLGVQRRVSDGPLARGERLRRQLHDRRRHGSPRQRDLLEHARSSCRSATTSTGRRRSARTSRPRATRASTSRSSAATRSTGRRAGSRASTARRRAYRTLVCYKEGTLGENVCGGKCDPLPNVWTGLWRDGCSFTPPADGCRPRTRSPARSAGTARTGAIEVPDVYKNLRFWRNTSVAAPRLGQTARRVLATRTRSATSGTGSSIDATATRRRRVLLLDARSRTARRITCRSTAHASGALVFGAGTVQWSWGLDGNHDRGSDRADAARCSRRR